ncbi:hypothetical protein KC356_g235 [Hortaea werneckii]|nr:hypothetical protein KC356_g235 [Hortaea werneckii]
MIQPMNSYAPLVDVGTANARPSGCHETFALASESVSRVLIKPSIRLTNCGRSELNEYRLLAQMHDFLHRNVADWQRAAGKHLLHRVREYCMVLSEDIDNGWLIIGAMLEDAYGAVRMPGPVPNIRAGLPLRAVAMMYAV